MELSIFFKFFHDAAFNYKAVVSAGLEFYTFARNQTWSGKFSQLQSL
jgi:hypothetical protein